MNKHFSTTLFIFRQDLRVHDNSGLRHAVQESKHVLPVFIFDTTILEKFPSPDKRIGFLVNALQLLEKEIQELGGTLQIEFGNPEEIIARITKEYNVDAIYRNKSYGSNSLHRDHHIKERAAQHSIIRKEFPDFLLVEPYEVQQMKVFTPFYKRWMGKKKRIIPDKIEKIHSPISPSIDREKLKSQLPYAPQPHRSANGATERIENFDFESYDDTRNFPGKDGSSRLSPYIRFGLISIRQLFAERVEYIGRHSGPTETGINHDRHEGTVTLDKHVFKDSFISELARREFWQHIAHYFPDSRHTEFLEKRQGLQRVNREDWFESRKEGTTGYPIVDAGMRQLKEENWMHGRVRMIVASFLTKDLLIDRRRGEEHFANYLLDYDENVNIGNRQWSASVGADPKPLRIFNPILQSERYDKDALYIKKWCPELKDVPANKLHNPLGNKLPYSVPVVDHYITSKLARKMYKHEDFSLDQGLIGS